MRQSSLFLSFFLLLMAHLPASAEELRTIVIDPGHGGYDAGIMTPELKEKEITLLLAGRIKKILDELDRTVLLTRKIDHYQSIEERRSITNRSNPDAFLSLHLSDSDAFALYIMGYRKKDENLTLIEYYAISSRQRRYRYESDMLSAGIAAALKENLGAKVFAREMSLPLLGSIGTPSVLIEVPSRGIDYGKDMRKVASSIVQGILLYEQGKQREAEGDSLDGRGETEAER